MKNFRRFDDKVNQLVSGVESPLKRFVSIVSGSCKRAVAHAIAAQVSRLETEKRSLELLLVSAKKAEAKTLVGKFKKYAAIKKLKQALKELHAKILAWIDAVCSRYCLAVS
jgi:hypothetical protein